MGVCAVHFSENDGCSDFKIVQYFHAVVCINFLNAITELFKIVNFNLRACVRACVCVLSFTSCKNALFPSNFTLALLGPLLPSSRSLDVTSPARCFWYTYMYPFRISFLAPFSLLTNSSSIYIFTFSLLLLKDVWLQDSSATFFIIQHKSTSSFFISLSLLSCHGHPRQLRSTR